MNFRSFSTLQIALGVSVAVHAVLLTVRFVDPEGFNRIFQDTPLEVILVNAKTAEKPDPAKAKAIAQHTLAGGGDAEKGRATTPLPASALTEMGDSPEDAQRKIEAMQEQQMLLLAQIRQQLAARAQAAGAQHVAGQCRRAHRACAAVGGAAGHAVARAAATAAGLQGKAAPGPAPGVKRHHGAAATATTTAAKAQAVKTRLAACAAGRCPRTARAAPGGRHMGLAHAGYARAKVGRGTFAAAAHRHRQRITGRHAHRGR